MAPYSRQVRVGESLRHLLVELFPRCLSKNGSDLSSLTVTEVRMSPDLRYATVFIIALGGGNSSHETSHDIIKEVESCSHELRCEIFSKLRLRYTPSLRFRWDDSFEKANKIEKILQQPKVAQDLYPSTPIQEQEKDLQPPC